MRKTVKKTTQPRQPRADAYWTAPIDRERHEAANEIIRQKNEYVASLRSDIDALEKKLGMTVDGKNIYHRDDSSCGEAVITPQRGYITESGSVFNV